MPSYIEPVHSMATIIWAKKERESYNVAFEYSRIHLATPKSHVLFRVAG